MVTPSLHRVYLCPDPSSPPPCESKISVVMNVTIPLQISNKNFFDANMTIATYTVAHGLGHNGYPKFTIGSHSWHNFEIEKRNQDIALNRTMILKIPHGNKNSNISQADQYKIIISEDTIATTACNPANSGAKHLVFNVQVTANVTLHSNALQQVAISRYCYFSCDITDPLVWCLK